MNPLRNRVNKLELHGGAAAGRIIAVRSNGARQDAVERYVTDQAIGYRRGVDQIAHIALRCRGDAGCDQIEVLNITLKRQRHG